MTKTKRELEKLLAESKVRRLRELVDRQGFEDEDDGGKYVGIEIDDGSSIGMGYDLEKKARPRPVYLGQGLFLAEGPDEVEQRGAFVAFRQVDIGEDAYLYRAYIDSDGDGRIDIAVEEERRLVDGKWETKRLAEVRGRRCFRRAGLIVRMLYGDDALEYSGSMSLSERARLQKEFEEICGKAAGCFVEEAVGEKYVQLGDNKNICSLVA